MGTQRNYAINTLMRKIKQKYYKNLNNYKMFVKKLVAPWLNLPWPGR